jgi:hypothetical protein
MGAPIVFLDTETDGVHPGRNVWEVAMIRRDSDGEREIQFFVDIDLTNSDPFGLKIGGFYERHPLGRRLSAAMYKPGFKASIPESDQSNDYYNTFAAAVEVAQWTHGAHIVGAVPNFDTEVLANMLRDNGLTPAWHYHLVDIEAMAVGYLTGRWAQARDDGNPTEAGPFDLGLPWKSDVLSRAVGVEPPTDAERHTALGDARWCKRWYDAMVGGESDG